MNTEIQELIAEYPENYCYLLEAIYGDSMMSEGGTQAIERMFMDMDIRNKSALDIGFGLGGVAFYLADKYAMHVTGLEINPWMIDEAMRRRPQALTKQLNFIEYNPYQKLPFADASFDFVYSKGVLTHLNEKQSLFAEIYRVLMPGGSLIVDDWLSPLPHQWGRKITQLCEAENLTLYAHTEQDYKNLLSAAGFTDIQMRSENSYYYHYNLAIVKCLSQAPANARLNQLVDGLNMDKMIEGHQLIADAINDNELLIRWFNAVK